MAFEIVGHAGASMPIPLIDDIFDYNYNLIIYVQLYISPSEYFLAMRKIISQRFNLFTSSARAVFDKQCF
jgi:hypothetical protein